MKITDYPASTSLNSDDAFVIEASSGTRKIATSDMLFSMIEALGSRFNKSSIFRGKYLGASVSPAQKVAIQDGTFKNLWIGDYWTVGGVNYRIADIDYWMGIGDTQKVTNHHLAIVTDASLYESVFEEGVTTGNGYAGSYLFKTGLNQAKTTVSSAFPGMVQNYKYYLTSRSTSGEVNNIDWINTTVNILNTPMISGAGYITPRPNNFSTFAQQDSDYRQLSLFRIAPYYIKTSDGGTYWLRELASNQLYGARSKEGNFFGFPPGEELGIRPVFAIG